MADINKQRHPGSESETLACDDPDAAAPDACPRVDRDPQLLEIVELLFFAYRDFTGDPDTILQELAFGRAHHRVLHFVGRYPGLRVADLLDILKITKQSLARVLKQLIDEGYIEQQTGTADRRERRLHLTPGGHALAARLLAPQLQRVKAAMGEPHDEIMTRSRQFLYNMIDRREQAAVAELFGRAERECGDDAGMERMRAGEPRSECDGDTSDDTSNDTGRNPI